MSDLSITADDADPDDEERREGFIEKLRHSGVGTEDPNIIGDAGPTDIPPGSDGDVLGSDENAPPE
jgi:hypothetical protein